MLEIIEEIEKMEALLAQTVASASSVFILTDEKVSHQCLPQLIHACPSLAHAEVIELEISATGLSEDNKSLDVCAHLWTHLLESNADRAALLINFGGGTVSDIGGFVASTYKRGIKYLNIPTTLMAMVDAAVGGKTGINHAGIKNCIGTFQLPITTIIYPPFIASMDEQQMKSGFAEMLKYGLIWDASLWAALMALDNVNATAVTPYISICAKIKAAIIEEDFDEKGNRKLLNLGHSIGHALESHFLNNALRISHGECVALGMCIESGIAAAHGVCSEATANVILAGVSKHFDFRSYALPPFSQIIPYLLNDKKNLAGEVRFAFAKEIGQGVYDVTLSLAAIESGYVRFQQ